jgi:hypothetical protein
VSNDIEDGQTLKPITVILRFTNEDGEQEEIYSGFLTGNSHAMYIDGFDNLIFLKVSPTSDPDVYVDEYGYCYLGELGESDEPEVVISALVEKLNSITAYQFLEKVLIHVKCEIEFEDWILPRFIHQEP